MTIVTSLIVFVLIWWLVLFMVLPWKAQPPANPPVGHATSAPERPMLWRKFLITTLISAVLFAIVFAVIEFDVISFRRTAHDLG